ncbi:MAG: lytic transglycosylase domain-containing protein [Halieaceae bacterium]|jgi:soluble lytic murein transglycosylase-like protein|nr:lytic transglycosylase domain-containing protein [Halieaceae bacterium]
MRLKTLVLLCLLACLPLEILAQAQPDGGEREQLRQFLERSIARASSFTDRYDAEVWLMDMSARMQPFVEEPARRLALLEAVHFHAREAALPPELVLAVIEVESRFQRFALSKSGAQGLMQVMPFWRQEIGRPDDNLTDIHTNLSYGCRILQFYLEQEQGQLSTALARYNGSAGSQRYPDKVHAAWRRHWRLEPLNWR